MATIMLIAIIKETIRRELNGTTFNGILLYRVCISAYPFQFGVSRFLDIFLKSGYPDIFTLTDLQAYCQVYCRSPVRNRAKANDELIQGLKRRLPVLSVIDCNYARI